MPVCIHTMSLCVSMHSCTCSPKLLVLKQPRSKDSGNNKHSWQPQCGFNARRSQSSAEKELIPVRAGRTR